MAAEAFADSFYLHFLFSLSSSHPHFFPSSALLLLGITLTPHRQSSTPLVTGLSLYPFCPYLPLFLSPYGMRPRLFHYNLSTAQTQPGPSRVRGRNLSGSSQGSWLCPESSAPNMQLPNQGSR